MHMAAHENMHTYKEHISIAGLLENLRMIHQQATEAFISICAQIPQITNPVGLIHRTWELFRLCYLPPPERSH